MLTNEELNLRLLANLPIPVEGAGELRIPALRKILETGLGCYQSWLSYLLISKQNIGKELGEEISDFDIFYANCYHNDDFRKEALQGLSFFFATVAELQEEEHNAFIDLQGTGKVDRTNFSELQRVLLLANQLNRPAEPEYKAGNSKAQEMINMILLNRRKQPKPKAKMDLHSIISGLVWKTNGLSLSTVFDLSIYQIYNGFFTTNQIDHYHYTLTGMYAGTIDGSHYKMSDIHWANKII